MHGQINTKKRCLENNQSNCCYIFIMKIKLTLTKFHVAICLIESYGINTKKYGLLMILAQLNQIGLKQQST
ncbi:hypothetical protein HanHA300_Chr11g0418511 [Helianthus annuus]|nr:hypothetical protein HanHA300_Chr11g0418511 [Helianthus annuus]